MNVRKNGVARRGRVKPLVQLASQLVFELLVGTLLLVTIVVIEGCGHWAIEWLAVHIGWRWLSMLLNLVEPVVVLGDMVCFLWVVLKSIVSFIKEVR